MSFINHNIKDTTGSSLQDLENQQIEIELNNNTDTMNTDSNTINNTSKPTSEIDNSNNNNNDNSLTDNNTLTNSNNSKLDDKHLSKKLHEEDDNEHDNDDGGDDSSIDSALNDNSLRQQLESNVYRERVSDYDIIPEGEIQLSSRRESDYDYNIKISPQTNKEDETNLFNKTYTNTNYYNIITKPNLSRTLSSPASDFNVSRKSSIINANPNSNNNNHSLLSGSAIMNTSPAFAAAVSSARSRANTLNNNNYNIRARDGNSHNRIQQLD
ncbi:unnamed protein product [[Candida] boidinii]|nr:unnamed protein product [[Candida] boidinii]